MAQHRRNWVHAVREAAAVVSLLIAASSACAALTADASAGPPSPGDSGTCDPSRATCVRPCSAIDAALGKCKPGDTGGGGGSGGGSGGSSGGGATCGPSPGGHPQCGGDGPASQGGVGGGVSVGAGNPINLLTGNKYQEEIDLSPLPGVLGLELKRHYNSRVPHAGLSGAHWRISYETVLYDFGTQIQILQADGRRLMFQRDGGALCSSPSWQDGQVRIETTSGGASAVYHWRWPDGRTLTFAGGSGGGHPLQSIAAPNGQRVTLHYGPDGTLLRVRDPQGRELGFVYAGGRLQAVDTPLGRVRYQHDRLGRLLEAARGDVTRIYHYEDTHNGGHVNALTGISVRGPDAHTGQPVEQRIATYGYNTAGQAILSVRGRPRETRNGQRVIDTGIEQVEVAYVERALPVEGRIDRSTGEVLARQLGRTIVTDSLGRKTEVLHAVIGGHHRLVEMRGAGCAGCGAASMRYGWDPRGQLRRATHLDDRGRARWSDVIAYDAQGRVARTGTQRARTPGAASVVAWKTRYSYPDRHYRDGSIALAPWPGRIEQPSVVADRVHELRIEYDALLRPRAWTERGYSPLDEQGQTRVGGRPIERTTTLRYADVGGVSVLAEIDGPLPNGPSNSPADSDITRLEWDPQARFVVGITLPLARRIALSHDDASGRLVGMSGPGAEGQRWRHAADGSLQGIDRMLGERVIDALSLRHDALGRLVEVQRLAGATSLPLLRQSFDIGGRLQWQVDALGILRQASYDSEGRLSLSRVASASMRQEERYRRDASGRLEQVEDDSGAVRRLVHDAAGRIAEAVDPLGRITRFRYDDASRLVELTQAAGTGQSLTLLVDDASGEGRHELRAIAGDTQRRLTITRQFDDFGREVMLESPDSGRVLRQHDAAGRVTHAQLADGATIDIAYDAAGRVLTRSVIPNAALGARAGGIPHRDALPRTTRYRYEGERLIGIEHAEQDEALIHDAAGRLVSRTVRLVSATGARIEHVLRYRYDERGQVIAASLPDGSELLYERNGQGQVVGLRRRMADGLPFGWGDEPLATDLQRDLVGPRQIVYGNGVAGRWLRSREGVLARVVYTPPPTSPPLWRTAFEALVDDAHASPPPTAATASAPAGGPGAFALAAQPHALWDARLLFDTAGNVLGQSQAVEGPGARRHHTTYAYDAQDQLAQATRMPWPGASRAVAGSSAKATVWRYRHDALGNRLLAQEAQPVDTFAQTTALAYADGHSNQLAGPLMDDRGRPLREGDRQERWDAAGRLVELRGPGDAVAHYRYDHRGLRVARQVGAVAEHHLYDADRHRLADLDAKGRITRQYVWLADQLIAVIDLDVPRVPHAPPRTFAERIGRTIAAAWRLLAGRGERIAYVHADHLGTPVLMTDRQARPVWSAEYAPFGQRLATPSRLDRVQLQLRLPGQWEDQESGLHYNDHRYYDPARGRYLSPDPLGPAGGLNAYAYAGNNPLGFSDPSGLLLFAFDGTGNDESDVRLVSNVVRFRDLYQDRTHYITGPGTPDPRSGIDNPWFKGGELLDIAESLTGKDRIARLIEDLNIESDAADDAFAIDIDVIGFSRGAAEARDFANQIAKASTGGYYRYNAKDGKAHCQKLDLRFMGLWDTVLSTHAGSYDLGIPNDFAYVAHAVGLNEYRALFPLESIRGGAAPPQGTTRIERGFLGSHSDIGGSFSDGDLSRVALAWMVEQAKAAGVAMNDRPELHAVIANPVLHDKSSNLFKPEGPAPAVNGEDRVIRYRDGTAERERRATIPGMSYPDTAQFIQYDADPHGVVAGTVDMTRYLAWLNAHGYGIDLKVE